MATTVTITPPVDPVVSIEQLRAQCKLIVPPGGTHPEDDLLRLAAASARRMAQHRTGRAVGAQTLELRLDAFPSGAIHLPLGPVSSIESVTYQTDDAGEQTVAQANYTLGDYTGTPVLRPLAPWPAAAARPDAVRVRYVAGDVTAATQQAILLIVGHYHRHKQAVTDRETHQLLLGVEALFGVDKVWNV